MSGVARRLGRGSQCPLEGTPRLALPGRDFCWPDWPCRDWAVAPAPASVMAPGWQVCLAGFSQWWALCLSSVLPAQASESHPGRPWGTAGSVQ